MEMPALRPLDPNEALQLAAERFETACKQHGLFYDLTSDEANEQGFLLKDKNGAEDVYRDVLGLIDGLNVHLDVDRNRKDGVLFLFTPEAIQDGYWKKPRKKIDYSIFANDDDAKAVRQGRAIGMKNHPAMKHRSRRSNEELMDRIDLAMSEGQYKSPTTKHLRSQSGFRSSFGKTKSFGGMTEGGPYTGAGSGSSIPPTIEKTGNPGVSGYARTNDWLGKGNGEGPITRPYNKRRNARSNPKTIGGPTVKEQGLLNAIDAAINERTIPRQVATVGRTNDPRPRRKGSKKVPGPAKFGGTEGPEELLGEPDRNPRADNKLGKDPKVVHNEPNPMLTTKRRNMARPLGVFGPSDRSKPAGGTAYDQEGSRGSNVRVQHPPDRSFDASSPKISVGKSRNDPPAKDSNLVQLGRLEKYDPVYESVYRPEDGYEFMQLLVRELGLLTAPRKVVLPDSEFVKACDGDVRLEFTEGTGDKRRSGTLTVYRRGRRLSTMDVDLEDGTTVDAATKKILERL